MNLKNSKLEKILEEKFYTRSNDKILFIEYLKDYHCETEIEKAIIEKVLLKAPTQASLQRSRAWYQNELGMYLPWLWVVNKRKQKAEEVKQRVREAKKDKVWIFDAFKRYFNNNK